MPLRRRQRVVIALLLACQLGALSAPAIALTCGSPLATMAADDDDACCAGLAPGQMCPMHKHRNGRGHTSPPPATGEHCQLRSGCEPPPDLLLSLTFGLGEPPSDTPAPTLVWPDHTYAYAAFDAACAPSPDLPPPRR